MTTYIFWKFTITLMLIVIVFFFLYTIVFLIPLGTSARSTLLSNLEKNLSSWAISLQHLEQWLLLFSFEHHFLNVSFYTMSIKYFICTLQCIYIVSVFIAKQNSRPFYDGCVTTALLRQSNIQDSAR